MGTPDFAAHSLRALAKNDQLAVTLVVCQADKPRGRDPLPQPPPVKLAALELGLPVYQPRSLRKGDALEVVSAARPEAIVVAAYGKILPAALLAVPPHGCLNVHASLLPELRGASPIQWAIVQGLARTGVSIMRMDEGLDTGDVLATREVPIRPEDDAEALHDRLMALGADLLVPTLLDWVAGRLTPQPQDAARASYAPLLSRDSGRIDWTRPPVALRDLVRGLHPWPGSFTFLKGRMLKVFPQVEALAGCPGPPSVAPGTVLRVGSDGLEVACGGGSVRIREVQLEGRRRMPLAEFVHGRAVQEGDRLVSTPEEA